jgi:hypothetical protein
MRIKSVHRSIVAAVAAMLSASAAVAAPASKGIVQRVTDPGTGLQIRVQQDRPGAVSVEIGDRTVTVRRELQANRLVTTVTTAGDTVSLTVDKNGLSVTSSRGRVRVSPAHPEAGEAVVRLLSGSPAVRRAADLLGRVNLGPVSPTGQTLLLTRAFLLSVAGEREEALEVVRSARAMLQRPRIVDARSGPGDCWDEYVKEALACYKEFEDCMRGLAWYDVLGKTACATLYDLRAIGAFSWWVSCVGLRGGDTL